MSGKQAKLQRRLQQANAVPDWSTLDIRMLREDVSWLYSLSQASQRGRRWDAFTGLALMPHMARVVHEGLALLRRLRPTQIGAVELKFAAEIAAARHAVKLLDDNKKLFEGVVHDFERIDDEHSGVWSRGEDLEIGFRDGRLFITSRAATFQRSFVLNDATITGKDGYSYRISYDIGGAAGAILRQFGFGPEATSLPVDQWGQAPLLTTVDRVAYYDKRYEPEFPLAVKDILTVIESCINSALHVFKPVEGPFTNPVFRVLFLTLAHSLNALDEVRGKYPDLVSRPGMSAVIEAIDTPAAVHLRGLRDLRNRCMHYGISSKLTNLDERLPMYGLVEATSPGHTYESVNSEMLVVLDTLSDTMSEWVQLPRTSSGRTR